MIEMEMRAENDVAIVPADAACGQTIGVGAAAEPMPERILGRSCSESFRVLD